ncbi:MAG: hypothetical protein LBS73_04555 [Campylobacteraceae bacterium]|jgi:hypothetical protein|nr:hypothetical protein [Campylobacteraceae bacterium]
MTHRFITLFTVILFTGFVSSFSDGCGGSSSNDEAGNIPGLGNNTGEISGEEFILPDGVEIDSSGIQGR